MLEKLRRLRQVAGRPSLDRLAQHASLGGHVVSRSALSDLLNGKGKPRLATVNAFVAACYSYARAHRPPIELATELFDLREWRASYEAAYPSPSESGSAASDTLVGLAPRQLPTALPRLAGRQSELAYLKLLLKESGESAGGTASIATLTGAAGVGKTALAVWWAHQIADSFPDGQLYVNLRGFESSEAMTKPEDAIRGFLVAFEIPPQQLPVDLESQLALYHSVLGGRRVLIVLDNARDADHAHALLPQSAGCLAIVTSRNDLSSLVVVDGAKQQNLDVLSSDDAEQLLQFRLGAERVAAEPEAVDAIIALGGGLPLALTIMAARAATHPALPLGALIEQIRQAQGLFDALASTDAAIDLRAVFSWSHQSVSRQAARLFRLAGLHPGPAFGAHSAASLAGISLTQASETLTELARASMLVEQTPGRYHFHDLLRAYALELTHTTDSEPERRSAVLRLLGHYLHTAHTADLLLDPHRDDRTTLAGLVLGALPSPLADRAAALKWFTVEHAALIAAVSLASESGFNTHAWQLAWAMTIYLDRRGHWQDWASVTRIALRAAEDLGDTGAQGICRRSLAHAYVQLGRLDDATSQLEDALQLFHALGDVTSEAATHNSLGGISDLRGQRDDALHHAQQAHNLFEAAGDQIGRAHALNSVGWCHAQLGDHEQAFAACQLSLTLLQEIGDRYGEAVAWDSLGYINHEMHKYDEAIACFESALLLFRRLDDRYYEATTLDRLSDSLACAGNTDASVQAWRRALTILDELGHGDAEQIRVKRSDTPDLGT